MAALIFLRLTREFMVLYPSVSALLALLSIWFCWWIWRFKIMARLRPNDPKEIPYLIPCIFLRCDLEDVYITN